jgi:hypothetical protein
MSSSSRRRRAFAFGVVLVAATTACTRSEEKPATRANTQEIAEDNEALNQLRAAGSNLTKPHHVEFYLYLPSEEEAESAATAVRPLGYAATVSAGEDEGNWLCVATRTMRPTIEDITVARALFTGLAQKHRGVYGGWNTAIEH